MALRLNFRLEFKGFPGALGKTRMNELLKAAFLRVGEYWHERFREKHFTVEGGREYGYGPRSGEKLHRGSKRWKRSYAGRKYSMSGGNPRPLVWTGESEQQARQKIVTATKHSCTVRIKAKKLNYRPQMRDEMTRVSPREQKALLRVFRDNLEAGLKGERTRGMRVTIIK